MLNRKTLKLAMATLVVGSYVGQSAFAQGVTTLRDPLIPGAQDTAPGIPATEGAPPPPGDGPTPAPVTPGMAGNPGYEPWVPSVPANSIDAGTSGISLPVSPAITAPPGVLGPALQGVIPPPPSTPGAAPAYLRVDGTNPGGLAQPAEQVQVPVDGGHLPGTGGYYGTIPKARRGGQQTHQFERRGLNSVLGGGGNSQDEVTLTGPIAGYGVPNGVPTGNGYNRGTQAGSVNRLSAIDLGGGMRMKVGGVKISTGSSLQDMGVSYTRDNAVAALHAHPSTDFGQGLRDNGVFSNNSTDYGHSYRQFPAANEQQQQKGQLLDPKAVETEH